MHNSISGSPLKQLVHIVCTLHSRETRHMLHDATQCMGDFLSPLFSTNTFKTILSIVRSMLYLEVVARYTYSGRVE